MDKFRGKKNDQKTAFVENDDNQTINEKKIKSNYDDNLNWITMDNDTIILDRGNYICTKCRFDTKNLKDFRRHLNTKKHKKKPQKKPQTISKKNFECLCGKMYKFQSGLSKHKKKCKIFLKKDKIKKTQKKTEKNAISGDIFPSRNEKNDKIYKKTKNIKKKYDDTGVGNIINKQFIDENGKQCESISVTKNDLEKIIEQTLLK